MKITIFVCSILLNIFTSGYAQKSKVETADKQYDQYAYIDAIAIYEKVAGQGYKDEKMFQKLGNAYYFNGELSQAEKWYEALFSLQQNQDAEYFYRYSQTLKSIGDYVKADKMLEQFNKLSGNEQRAKLYENNKNYLEKIKANSGRYNITDAEINSEFSDYGSYVLNNNLIFASARDTIGVSKKIFKWTNQSFTNLYSSEMKQDGTLGTPKLFSKVINSKFHESTPTFTKDGKTMYFTRNNYLDRKKGKNSDRITLLKLYKSTFENGQWTNIVELPFNSDQYSVAHPALSADDNTLYFVSDMPGTFGESDLYKVSINKDGSYGTPENLGSTINTEGRETFPFISDNNELYFASDGRPGLGGLDIFVTKLEKNNSFDEIQNVGTPINSGQDDFGFFIDNKTRSGFFSSNREGGKGYDDIYKFTETRKLWCEQFLYGEITDLVTAEILPEAKISLYDSHFDLVATTVSDKKGNYSFAVECGETYNVRAEKMDYATNEQKINIPKENKKTYLPIALEKAKCKVAVGDDLGKCFGIKMIYFDLDKSYIRNDAAFELEKILAVMRQYPNMKIDIRSHTDSRQTAQYNLILSDKRAKATMSWLIQHGISDSRLTARGYGETRLVNKCADGVDCTEAEHQANRRSEFIITHL